MQEQTDRLLTALAQQNQLLSQILDRLDSPKLGLVDAPSTLWIYANRSNGGLWYSVKDGEVVPISRGALTGTITDLKLEKVERKGKEVIKLQAFIKGDRPYCVESGHDSHFSKGLLSAIAFATAEQLRAPITIQPQSGTTDEAVLFCRLFTGSEPIKATYSGDTDWRAITRSAIDKVRAATGTAATGTVPELKPELKAAIENSENPF